MADPTAKLEHLEDRVIAHLSGTEVSTDGLRTLLAGLKARLDNGTQTFVFCFAKVDFLPSACLAQLLMFHEDAKRHDARIVLLNCQENVAFLLRLARLDALFELAQGQASEV